MDEQEEKVKGQEEKKTEETPQAKDPEPPKERPVSQDTTPVLDKALEVAQRIEAANQQTAELLTKQESLMAERALGGTAMAGGQIQQKEESPEEYANKFLKGEIPNILNIQEQ